MRRHVAQKTQEALERRSRFARPFRSHVLRESGGFSSCKDWVWIHFKDWSWVRTLIRFEHERRNQKIERRLKSDWEIIAVAISRKMTESRRSATCVGLENVANFSSDARVLCNLDKWGLGKKMTFRQQMTCPHLHNDLSRGFNWLIIFCPLKSMSGDRINQMRDDKKEKNAKIHDSAFRAREFAFLDSAIRRHWIEVWHDSASV